VVGCDPRLSDGSIPYCATPEPRIGVALSRGAGVVAVEIARRLLPQYLDRYRERAAVVAQMEGAASEARLVASRLAGAVGAELSTGGWRSRGPGDEVHLTRGPEAVSRLRVSSGYRGPHSQGEVRVSFDVSGLDPETALEALSAIRDGEERRERERELVRVDIGSETELEDWDVVEVAEQRASAERLGV
jgi:hypothetical protein